MEVVYSCSVIVIRISVSNSCNTTNPAQQHLRIHPTLISHAIILPQADKGFVSLSPPIPRHPVVSGP